MEILTWLLSFFIVFALLCIVVYQHSTLSDLEFDFINPYDTSSQINRTVFPEFILLGVHCAILVLTRQWLMLMLALPHLYNIKLYVEGRHMIDVTEIFNQLQREKKQRTVKAAYLSFELLFSLFWFLWTVVAE